MVSKKIYEAERVFFDYCDDMVEKFGDKVVKMFFLRWATKISGRPYRHYKFESTDSLKRN